MAKKRLGELLIERRMIDIDQLNSALAHQRQWGVRLGAALVAKGFMAEGALTRVLSESLQIPMVDLAKVVIDEKALKLVRASTAEQFEIFPIAVKEHKARKTLLLAMADPLNVAAVDEIAFTTDMTVRPAIAQMSSLRAAIRRYYYNERIEIPPLDFTRRIGGAPKRANDTRDAPSPEASMTITMGGSTEERVVDAEGDVIDLTKEVEAMEAQARARAMQQAAMPPGMSGAMPMAPGMPPGVPPPGMGGGAMPPYAPPPLVDPFQAVATTPWAYYQGQPTGAYMMPLPPAAPPSPPVVPLSVVQEVISAETNPTAELEKKFWALMRVLARKGLISRDEFLNELKNE